MLTGVAGSSGLAGCENQGPGGSGGQAGTTGAGGCPTVPQPMFTVTITAPEEGRVPPDTSIEVSWSAGVEPAFALDDPATWGTLDGGANVVCDVDRAKPPPADLPELVCRLWTSGATEIKVSAGGFDKHVETLVPMQSEECGGAVPKDVVVELLHKPDGGVVP